jgi:preprotein translocase subunit YajC
MPLPYDWSREGMLIPVVTAFVVFVVAILRAQRALIEAMREVDNYLTSGDPGTQEGARRTISSTA